MRDMRGCPGYRKSAEKCSGMIGRTAFVASRPACVPFKETNSAAESGVADIHDVENSGGGRKLHRRRRMGSVKSRAPARSCTGT